MPECPNDNSRTSTRFVVRTRHLNHHGHLFGGEMMSQMDLCAYCETRRLFPACTFVTRAGQFSFEKPAHAGDIVTFCAEELKRGRTSLVIGVCGCVDGDKVCGADMTFVRVDDHGHAAPLPD